MSDYSDMGLYIVFALSTLVDISPIFLDSI